MSAAIDTKDGDHRARVVATIILGLSAIAIWAPVLGGGVVWGLPMVAFAAWIVAHGAAERSPRMRWAIVLAWPVWVVLGLLFAGLSPAVLLPGSLGSTKDALGQALIGLRSAGGEDPWSLAVWLIGSGGAWFVGAVQAARPARLSVALAFFTQAAPFAGALLLQRADDAPWHGAVVLAAGLLWAARSELRASLPAVAGVALVAVAASAAIGPSERRIDLTPGRPDFARLDTRQTYGPMRDDRTGATMFEVRSARPALWRSQVLDWFDGRAWGLDPLRADEPLPQPAAVQTTTTVQVRGLRDQLAVAPGRVVSASIPGRVGSRPAPGEAAEFGRSPQEGTSYSVLSEVVAPTAAQISGVQVPAGRRFSRFQQVFPTLPDGDRLPLAQIVAGFSPETLASPWGRVYSIANDLSKDARSQLEVVNNVQAYLLDPQRFRYTTDVAEPGSDPLVDFLVTSRQGYCQHFAGAAALLLRLANVPTRVAVGFATGLPSGQDRWEVRDLDAHAWIEVYFAGTGWVPFNPTPGDADAQVSPDAAVATPTPDLTGADRAAPLVGLGVLAALLVGAGGVALWRRRTDPAPAVPLGDVLVRLVPAPAGPSRTLSELAAELAELGPRIAALAREAEQQRFGPAGLAPEGRPRRRVLKALIADVGLFGTARLLVLGPGRRPVVEEVVAGFAPAMAPPSVAPPSRDAPPGPAAPPSR